MLAINIQNCDRIMFIIASKAFPLKVTHPCLKGHSALSQTPHYHSLTQQCPFLLLVTASHPCEPARSHSSLSHWTLGLQVRHIVVTRYRDDVPSFFSPWQATLVGPLKVTHPCLTRHSALSQTPHCRLLTWRWSCRFSPKDTVLYNACHLLCSFSFL